MSALTKKIFWIKRQQIWDNVRSSSFIFIIMMILFVFVCSMQKWQRRFFILYEHGLLRYALDEMVSNVFSRPHKCHSCLKKSLDVTNARPGEVIIGIFHQDCLSAALLLLVTPSGDGGQTQRTNFPSLVMWQSVWLQPFLGTISDHRKPCLLIIIPTSCQGEKLLMGNSVDCSPPFSPSSSNFSGHSYLLTIPLLFVWSCQ